MRSSTSGRLRRVVPGGLLAVLLGVAASVLVACGQSNGLLSSDDSASLGDRLGQVSDAVAARSCSEARRAATQLELDARRLSPTVDADLRRALRRGAATVGDRAARACRTQPTNTETITTATTTTTAPTTPPPTTATTTPPTTATTTPPTTATTTPPTTATTTTTTPPPTPTTPPPPTTPTDTTPLTTPTAPSGGATPGGGGTGTVP